MRRAPVVLVALATACGGARGRSPDELAPAPVTAPPLAVEPGSAQPDATEAPYEVFLGETQICVRDAGLVRCGTDDDPPLGTRRPLPGVADAITFASPHDTTCAVIRGGEVRCVGDNRFGLLGAHQRVDRVDSAVPVVGARDASRVVVARDHACAVAASGLFCWGENGEGQTGGTVAYAEGARELVEATRVPIPSVSAVALASGSTCAVTKDRQVYCWGRSILDAQTKAQGSRNERPWRVTELDGLEDLAAGESAFCGVRAGEVLCWGDSYSLFGSFRGAAGEPRKVEGLPPVRRVRLSSSHACALTTDRRVFCWGGTWTHALGHETGEDTSETVAPQAVEGLTRARDVMVGGSLACASVDGGDVLCWGRWPWTAGRTSPRIEHAPVKLRVRDCV